MAKNPAFSSLPRGEKIPNTGGKDPSGAKVPKVAADEGGYYSERPSWRFSLLEMVDEFGWHGIESKEKLIEIIDRLKAFETMTWGEIIRNDTNGSHFIEAYRLSDRDAKKKLEALKVPFDTFVCSLRHQKKERIWGIRDGTVLKLLWWDPEHLIYECDWK